MISSNAASCLMTLADGTPGQKMSIACRIFTSAITITPATFTGGTTLTMSAAGDSVELVFLGEGSAGGWYIIGNNSVVIS